MRSYSDFAGLNLILLFLAFVCGLLSYSTELFEFYHKNQVYKYNFFECIDCPFPYKSTSIHCLSQECTNGSLWLCEKGKTLESTISSLIYSEFIANTLLVLLMQKSIFMILKRNYGSKGFSNAIAVMLISCKTIGLAASFSISNMTFENCYKHVCGKNGMILIVVSYTFAILGGVSSILLFKISEKFPKNAPSPISKNSLLGKVLPLICISNFFLICSLFLPWAFYFNIENAEKDRIFIELTSKNCYPGQDLCTSEYLQSLRHCTTLQNLKSAGILFYFCIQFGIIFQLLWLEYLFFHYKSLEFGFPHGNYIVTALCLICYISAFLCWFCKSGAKLSSNCKVKAGDTEIALCADTGSILGIVSCLLIGISSISYISLYYFRICFRSENNNRLENSQAKCIDTRLNSPTELPIITEIYEEKRN